ncbi:MAG: dynamin family protein [Drouetiella hepatica Uher 2000/2452]|jgi:replication fork clamp-binding protein CrfC|uniref:Dynamin family protein n=1 Tax=Drouetiella hepatica Uher 2000/2452 TaxID=904376 RepID=A0A951Q835_9CYAN|nr:dynamin family protein [Drouetiella hepatica Uher 2000/2452]
MSQAFPQCQNLQEQVNSLLELQQQEPLLRSQDTTAIQNSLRKAIAPTFEIVFAGAFSAGKSMLINALLERELLYSAEGHATGTECQIAYAELDQERVVLTFLSEAEIRQQATLLCERLGLTVRDNINRQEVIDLVAQACQVIIEQEGGESKSDRAKQASALRFLLEGFVANREHIHTVNNNTFSMERFNFRNLQEAASYARRGANSAVLKRVEYYCHHELLRDGNVLVDTPGIDAPVKKDAELTYAKIENPDTSAVVCVLKPAAAGDMTTEETELLEKTKSNPGIRDRVFYVFNRIDETWYNTQLRQRLERLLQEQFRDSSRVYKTSGLLGFFGSQLKVAGRGDRFGLDTLFAASQVERQTEGQEETPQFVSEFNRYCASSGKLPADRFRIDVKSYESPNENYVRILSETGSPLIEQLIKDSGIEEFRTAITRYLTTEKRPLLLSNLADDLQPLSISLKKSYVEAWQHLGSQPQDINAIKEQELRQLSKELKQVGDRFRQDIEQTVNEAVASDGNLALENSFSRLKTRMVLRLDELLNTFSVGEVHKRAQASHKRHSVVPLLGILAEAFYYLADGLEEVLVDASQEVIATFFQALNDRVHQQDYYRNLYRLLGNDGGIEASLIRLQQKVSDALVNEARTECDRYVRERPEFYTEGTSSMWQLRQTLQQACRGYDYQNMVEAEPAIRQLLKLDFEQKVKETVLRTFRQTINQTLNVHLLQNAADQADVILQQYDQARAYLAQVLDKEAEEKIRSNQRNQAEIEQKIAIYNQAIAGINACLEMMQLDRKKLPEISKNDLAIVPVEVSPVAESEEEAIEAEVIEAIEFVEV